MSTLRVTNIQDLNGNQVLSLSGGNAIIAGDLTIQGTTTSIETTNLIIEDKNIILGQTDPAATDATADGGGITLKGTTDKTIAWTNATDAWTSSERFSVPLGTEAAPSLTFTGDENTGIYSPGADQVAVATNGTGRLFINSEGRVTLSNSDGIQLSAKASSLYTTNGSLSYYGATNGVYLTGAGPNGNLSLYAAGSESSRNAIIINASAAGGGPDTIQFRTAASERLRITSAGLVGIGTSSPSKDLHIQPSADNGGILIKGSFANRFTAYTSPDTDAGYRFGYSETVGGLIQRCDADGAFVANAMVFDSSGRVGIGTTSPSTLLHAAGGVRVGANDASDAFLEIGAGATGNRTAFIDLTGDTTYSDYGFRIQRENGGSNTTSRLLHRGTGDFRLTAQEAAPIAFWTTNTERARIDSNGNVGIGTTNPSAKLDIRGSADSGVINNLDLWNTSAAAGNQGALLRLITRNAANSSTSSTDIVKYQGGESSFRATDSSGFFTFYTGGYNERIRILSGGNVGINTTTPGSRLAVNGSITESTDGGTTYHNVVTAQDIGTDPNQVPLNQFLGQLAFMDSVGDVPTASSAPQDNLSVNFEYVSNTSLKIRMRGTDGVVRSVTLTLS